MKKLFNRITEKQARVLTLCLLGAAAVLLSAAVSSLFYYAPLLRELSRGWVIILCAVGVSALMAWKFPVPAEVRDEPAGEEEAP